MPRLRSDRRLGGKLGVFSGLVLLLLVLSSANVSSAASTVSASGAHHPITLKSPEPQEGGWFGLNVGISGGLSIVGAPFETVEGNSLAGDVYVYNSTTGAYLRTLTSPYPQPSGDFGFCIFLSGELAIVGAPGESSNGYVGAGNAYIFDVETGSLVQSLTSPNAQDSGGFGGAVAISGNLAIVGAYNENVGGHDGAGRAYVFEASTGALVDTLSSPNSQALGSFGTSVAISGNLAVVGAVGETVQKDSAAGRAYVFRAKTGRLVQTLTSPNAQDNGWFGTSVDIMGNNSIVSAPLETADGYSQAGHAYLFNPYTGALIESLTSPNAQTGGLFGVYVATNGNVAVVGANGETADGLKEAGNAYLFNANTGALIKTLNSPKAQTDGLFGEAVAIDGGLTIIGAPTEKADGHPQAGHAYIFRD